MHEHNGLRIALIICELSVFIVVIVFTALAWVGNNGIFIQSTNDVQNNFPTEITPDVSLYWIYIATFAWDGGMILYEVSTICRKDKEGVYIYLLDLTPPYVYFFDIISYLAQISWLFAWDREVFIALLVIEVVLAVSLIVALIFSIVYLNQGKDRLIEIKMTHEIKLVELLVQSNLILEASIVTLSLILNTLPILMIYCGNVAIAWSSTSALIILAILITLWFCLDMFLLNKYVSNVVTSLPYAVVIVALVGIMIKNFDLTTTAQTSLFTLVLVVLTSMFLLSKLIILLWIAKKSNSVSIY